MKPIYHFFRELPLLVGAALLALCCAKEGTASLPEEGDGVMLTLNLSMPDAPATKTTVEGDDSRNENVIEWVDIFLFSGAGTAGTEVLRTPYQHVKPEQDPVDHSVHTVSLFLSNAVLDRLFGTTHGDPGEGLSATAKIVVVANGDALSDGNYMIYPDSATSSVQAVKESVAKTNFNAWYAENLNYLIMCGSSDVTLTHDASTHQIKATGTVPMERSYAKLDIELELPPYGKLEHSGHTYKANLETMEIELLNVVYRGYVGSSSYVCQDADFYATTGARTLTASGASGSPLQLTHNCFYSYPRNFSDVPLKKTEYRIKIEWTEVDPEDNPVSGNVHTGYYFFPVADEDAESGLLANHYYHTIASVHTLGSPEASDPEELSGSWEILPWGDAPIYGTFNDYEYLMAQPTWVNMHGLTEGVVTYKSSSSISSYSVTSVRSYSVDMDGSGSDDGREIYSDITAPASLAAYTLSHDPATKTITLSHPLTGMYFRQEITVVLQNSDGLEETVVFEQTPPIEVRSTGHQGTTDNFFINGLKIAQSQTLDYVTRPPASVSSANLRYNLRLIISNFSTDNNQYVFGDPNAATKEYHEYVVGDTRIRQTHFQTSGFNFTGTYQWTQEELSEIMIADTRIGSADWIAPDIICCTGLATAQVQDRAAMEKRAAMYQESGYPAGRWRLMTEAEFKFLADLQIKGKIPSLFLVNATYGYWTAQNTCYRFNTSTSYVKVNVTNSTTAGARFVYDAWYWGPDPVPGCETTYTPMP